MLMPNIPPACSLTCQLPHDLHAGPPAGVRVSDGDNGDSSYLEHRARQEVARLLVLRSAIQQNECSVIRWLPPASSQR
ncbi:unnamed protein product [Arctogadus glacialis]